MSFFPTPPIPDPLAAITRGPLSGVGIAQQAINGPLTAVRKGASALNEVRNLANVFGINVPGIPFIPGLTGAGINDLQAQISGAFGLSRPTRYMVHFGVGKVFDNTFAFDAMAAATRLSLNDLFAARRIQLFCMGAELPARTFNTSDQRTYGPTFKAPFQSTYADITFTFIVGNDMFEKHFFDAWANAVEDPSTQDYAYRSDYSCDIKVHQLDELSISPRAILNSQQSTYIVRLIDAWPVSVGNLQLGYDQFDQFHKLSVTFTYRRWINDAISDQIKSQGGVSGPITSFAKTVTPKPVTNAADGFKPLLSQ